MKKAMYPGTFDPITVGHLDVISRASKLFEEVVVVIMVNENKTVTFSPQERLAMIETVIKPYHNVRALIGKGLTVEFAQSIQASVLIRGIRAVMDYEYELQQATANMLLAPQLETVFLLTKPEYSFMSSTAVKEIARNHGALDAFLPPEILTAVRDKFEETP